jgi:hypothetical protein
MGSKPLNTCTVLAGSCGSFSSANTRALLALQFPQHVGHAHAGEGQVVPAGGLGVVAVVGAQVGVQVVGTAAHAAAGARAGDQRQVGRVGAEPVLGVLGVERDLHRVADLVAGEHQVLLDLVFGQADVAQAVVAHEGRAWQFRQ